MGSETMLAHHNSLFLSLHKGIYTHIKRVTRTSYFIPFLAQSCFSVNRSLLQLTKIHDNTESWRNPGSKFHGKDITLSVSYKLCKFADIQIQQMISTEYIDVHAATCLSPTCKPSYQLSEQHGKMPGFCFLSIHLTRCTTTAQGQIHSWSPDT